ncbi:hypothetical protein ABT160_35640 [Streptomyces sp. NPDC001941]|uniref:hypothetical protein n=1 Tax=Streptomyces sp. NPDC001941 TaxID=3154659 RepID=UPI00332BD12A
MRGLSARQDDPGAGRARSGLWAASTTAVAGLAVFGLLVAGCATGGTGTRDAGPASVDRVSPSVAPTATGTPLPAKKVNPVELLKEDPKVSARIKADLKPCAADAYPVDTSYGNLTGGTAPDVVVNVMTCGDAVGLGTYVYREDAEKYQNVFAVEEPAVYSTIDRGDLVVNKPLYEKGDSMAYPSAEEVVTYRWAGNKFTEHDRVRNEYSRAVGGGDEDTEPKPTAPKEN